MSTTETSTPVVASDERIESWLAEYGAEATPAEIQLTDIDLKSSHANQARLSAPIRDDLVEQYTTDMREGAAFPPVVVYEGRNGFVVIDGNHRVAAAMALESESFPAYIVTNPNANMVRALTYSANTRHGMPTSKTERVQQAMFLVESGNMQQNHAARLLGVDVKTLRYNLAVQATMRRLRGLGFHRVHFLNRLQLTRLASIKNDHVLAEAADYMVMAKPSVIDSNAFITEVNAKRTEEEALAYIAEQKAEQKALIETTVGGKTRLPADVLRITQAVGRIENIDLDKFGEAELAPEYAAKLKERVTDAVKTLTSVRNSL